MEFAKGFEFGWHLELKIELEKKQESFPLLLCFQPVGLVSTGLALSTNPASPALLPLPLLGLPAFLASSRGPTKQANGPHVARHASSFPFSLAGISARASYLADSLGPLVSRVIFL